MAPKDKAETGASFKLTHYPKFTTLTDLRLKDARTATRRVRATPIAARFPQARAALPEGAGDTREKPRHTVAGQGLGVRPSA